MSTDSYAHADAVRIDRWLHATRWFKTRAIAVEAINMGRVEINQERVKPAKTLRVGDQVRVRRPPYVHDLVVEKLIVRRVGADAARLCYRETEQSVAAAAHLRETLALEKVAERPAHGKLNKKERRDRERLKRSSG